MGQQPDEHRQADELVEPLFAGLRGADPASEKEPQTGETSRPDPWKHPARPNAPPLQAADLEGEPSTTRLFMKALLLMTALIAIGALFYLVFGV